MPGAVPGFCNLECWCHVPTRGVVKPPCYLCVIDCCSLSSKKEAPSAPSLETLEATDQERQLPSPSVETETQQDVGVSINPRGSHYFQTTYGWQPSFQRHNSWADQTSADSQDVFAESYINIPSEQENVEPVPETENPGPSAETEPLNSVFIPEPDYNEAEEEIPEPTDEIAENEDEETTNEEQAEERNAIFMTGTQLQPDTSCARPVDLAELLRNVMIDPVEDQSDEEDEDATERNSRLSGKQHNERSSSRRRRDRSQGVDKYQSFYNTGAKPYVITRASLTRHQNVNNSPAESETEFQKLHKIHRRDTSSDAARRYLQSDENLHRTWWKQVSSRKRYSQRRIPSSKRYEGASSHRPLSNLEEIWRSQRS